MRVHLGSDHAGFELKEAVKQALVADGHDVVDHGAVEYDALDDYPPFCIRAAEAVRAEEGSLGFVFGGSGNGEQLAANRVQGVRAVLGYSREIVELGRQHNGAQILAMGGRFTSIDDGIDFARTFIATPFSGDERHQRRIDQMTHYETTGEIS